MYKTVKVSGKIGGAIESHEIDLAGVKPVERLTPKMAIMAALVVFNHRSGITVSDTLTAYRVYANSVRKLSA